MTDTGKRIEIIEIVECLSNKYDVEFYGNGQGYIEGYASLESMRPNRAVWLRGPENVNDERIRSFHVTDNLLIVCSRETSGKIMELSDNETNSYIITETPRDVFFSLLSHFFSQNVPPRIDYTDSVIRTESIGSNVCVGANCYIGEDVKIGNGVIIHNNVVIECPCTIGDNTVLHSGVVIGTRGFGYYTENGMKQPIPHFMGVQIGHHVEIGANSCIDQGCLTDTVIGNYVKIDNLVHIAHNVRIADHCMIVAASMLCGSVNVGERTYIAPGVKIIEQTKIGADVFLGIGSVVNKNIPDNMVAVGYPAREVKKNREKE